MSERCGKTAQCYDDLLKMIQNKDISTIVLFSKDKQEHMLYKQQYVDKLKKENNDLRRLYQRTYKHLFEKGNDELARYFQSQIDECPTFYVEPIIDYYEETKRLNNNWNKLKQWCIESRDGERKEKWHLVKLDKDLEPIIENNIFLYNKILIIMKDLETR